MTTPPRRSETGAAEQDYEWHKCADSVPDMPAIVWVSEGGGTALLGYFDSYRWKSAVGIRDLPFTPLYWQHLRLPSPPTP